MDASQTTVSVPAELAAWYQRFQREQWSGSLTFHFNQGKVQSYEPKPTLRISAHIK